MTTPRNKYAAMSRDYMERAEGYLQRHDLVQASEKSWAAATCGLKAIAAQRGWNHQSHSLLSDLSNQVAEELGRPNLQDLVAFANTMHQNLYENWMPVQTVEYGVGRVKTYLAELDAVSPELPASFVKETRAQSRRLSRLTAESEPL